MPRLAAFPKAYVDGLCIDGTMTLREWIEIGASLQIEGLEFYTRFLELQQPGSAAAARKMAADLAFEGESEAVGVAVADRKAADREVVGVAQCLVDIRLA